MHHKSQPGSVNTVLLVVIIVILVGGYFLITTNNQTESAASTESAQLANNSSSTPAGYSPPRYSSTPTSSYYSPSATTVPSQCISAEQASANMGSKKCIEFLVGSTYTSSRGQMYLNQYTHYSSGFSVWIPAGNTFGSSVLLRYSGKKIDVTGTISSYKGSPEVVVTSKAQLSLAP